MRRTTFFGFMSAIFAIGVAVNCPAHAQISKNEGVQVTASGVVATAPGQTSAAVYLSVKNLGVKDDNLISITSPIAKEAVLHSMIMNGNVMKMREVVRLFLPPMTKVSLQPDSGYHIMLTGLRRPLEVDDEVALTLSFEHARPVTVTTKVFKDKASLR
jgi:copper(I)-binding protein